MRAAASAALLLALVEWAPAARADAPGQRQLALPAPTEVTAVAPANDDGHHVEVSWTAPADAKPDTLYVVLRSPLDTAPQLPSSAKLSEGDWLGGWQVIKITADTHYADDVTNDYAKDEAPAKKVYRTDTPPAAPAAPVVGPPAGPHPSGFRYAVASANKDGDLVIMSAPSAATPRVHAVTSYFDTSRWFLLLVILVLAGALWYYTTRIKKNPKGVFIRRIAGVDAIEDAVGRSTEMGRPVLYVTGTDDIQNIQTIASLLVLGRVAEMTAEYDTEIKVANLYPLTMVVAEEIVRQGFAEAGRIDAHKPENVMFISSEQFAFAAGINGMILRDRPATNIYLGRFFAESLILAETGFVTGAVQIAGTAEITQLPFFIAACDYTLIGEELYAVSAYLTREPGLLAMLKLTDLVKLGILILLFAGMVGSLFGVFDLAKVLLP